MFNYNLQSNQTKPLNDLIATESPTQLLSNSVKRQTLLDTLYTASGLESSRYDSLCVSLIRNVANQCQHLPESANSYYADRGGFLDNILNRTEAAIQLFRHYLIQDSNDALSEEQTLWIYALFSAGILQGIGKLQTDYRIDLYEATGHFLKQWQPILENLTSIGSHYHYEFLQANDDALRCRLNLILAYKLMPASGLSWIASNPEVLAIWLALLDEDIDAAGTLGAVLERAQAIASQRYISEFIHKNSAVKPSVRSNRIPSFVDGAPEAIIGKERLIGAEFMHWLNQALQAGEVQLNKAKLLTLSVDVFKQFIQANTKYKNWHAVQHAFLAWGNHEATKINGSLQSHQKAPLVGQKQHTIEIDKTILPDEVHVYDEKTDTVALVPALEVGQMVKGNQQIEIKPLNSLSTAGKWVHVEGKMPWMPSGLKLRV